jgi:hypothetical protein
MAMSKVRPGRPVLGLTEMISGPSVVTVTALASVTTWVPVVTVSVLAPGFAFKATVIKALRVVAVVTVMLLTVIPCPRLT